MKTRRQLLRGLDILVVDDHPEITSLLAEVLSDCGARVLAANSGPEAMALAASGTFDLVILDLAMPHPDGFEVIEFLRATDPDLLQRTLVLTGHKFDREAMALLETLHIRCILKPFLLDDLIQAASRTSLPSRAPAA
jgi:CheY-like chemotaxis protein